jgi:hypothetical protein
MMSDSSNINPDDDLVLWTLVNLALALEEINDHLTRIGLGFDRGDIDFAGFEQTLMDLNECQTEIEDALASYDEAGLTR